MGELSVFHYRLSLCRRDVFGILSSRLQADTGDRGWANEDSP